MSLRISLEIVYLRIADTIYLKLDSVFSFKKSFYFSRHFYSQTTGLSSLSKICHFII